MPKEIIIKNYDLKDGLVETEEISSFLGLNIEGKHYVISKEDYCERYTSGRGGLVIPKTAYELVTYDKKTGTAKAKEVSERSLLERIAIEFHMQRIFPHKPHHNYQSEVNHI